MYQELAVISYGRLLARLIKTIFKMYDKVMSTPSRGRYFLYLYILLGALSAFPPLVTDMYLPALPAMAEDFQASPSQIQLSLAMCIIGLATGQLFFGPLSDKYGRRPVLGAALALFIIATLACIMAPSIALFNVARFAQGLGGAGGVVLSRSVATDCYSGRELAKTLAIIGAINGIAPVTAPVIGGLFAGAIGWQGIFWILFGVGIVLTAMYIPFRESHPVERRYTGNILHLFRQSGSLFKNRRYMLYVVIFSLTNGVLFGYISSASFILQNDFGLSEMMFGILFAINSLGIVSGSMLSLKFRNLYTGILTGTSAMLLCTYAMLLSYFLGAGLWGYEICAFLTLFCVGLLFPSSSTLAMQEGNKTIGWASAILGATGFLFGGVVTPLAGIGTIRLSAAIALTVCAAAAWIMALSGRRRPA